MPYQKYSPCRKRLRQLPRARARRRRRSRRRSGRCRSGACCPRAAPGGPGSGRDGGASCSEPASGGRICQVPDAPTWTLVVLGREREEGRAAHDVASCESAPSASPTVRVVSASEFIQRCPLLRSARPMRPSAPPSSARQLGRRRALGEHQLLLARRVVEVGRGREGAELDRERGEARVVDPGVVDARRPFGAAAAELGHEAEAEVLRDNALDAEARAAEVGTVGEVARARDLAVRRSAHRAAPEVDRPAGLRRPGRSARRRAGRPSAARSRSGRQRW